ncbi:MAG: sugar-binding protein [Clostridia bacterium]|nr:sugar-binding protein [Clostridia bacterium]
MKRFLATLVVLTMCFAMGSAVAETLRVGVSMPTQSLQRWNQDALYLTENLEAAGYEVDLQFADNDATLQLSQVENMIANGANAIVITAVEASSLGTAMDLALQMGVPVIAHDRLIVNTEALSYYASFDNYKVGMVQGQFLIDALGLAEGNGPFNMEIIAGDPGDTNAGYFYAGAMDLLTPFIENGQLVVPSGQTAFDVVATPTWATPVAQARFDTIIAGYYTTGEELHAVLCSNDSTAMGAINALTNAGFTEDNWPFITGQDCDKANMQYIVSGKQAMSVFKDTRTLAARTLSMVKAVLEGSEPEVNDTTTYDNGVKIVPSFLCEPVFGSAANYVELLIDTGYYIEIDGEFFTQDDL